MSALVTAAEAQALLDAAPAGPYDACHPDDLPGRSIVMGGRECRPPYDVFVVGIEDRPRVALAELFAAAPSLARTVVAQATACAALRDAVQEYLAAEDERALAADACDDDPSSENEARLNEADECLDAARTRLAALVGGAS